MEKIKIKEIKIEIGEKTLTLSIDQAKELRAVLNEIYSAPFVSFKEDLIQFYDTWNNLEGDAEEPLLHTYTSYDNVGHIIFNCD